jgi:hypothetical protein
LLRAQSTVLRARKFLLLTTDFGFPTSADIQSFFAHLMDFHIYFRTI